MSDSATKSRILAVAQSLFHQQGFEATGISLILKQAGVNSGSLYHFFSSKEALLVAVIEQHRQALAPTILVPVEAATSDPIERVFALLAFYRRELEKSGCSAGSPIGNLALEVGSRNPEVRRQIDLYFRDWTGRVEGWLTAAADRLPTDVDRPALARLVLTVMEGATMQARAASSLEPFDSQMSQLRAYFDLLEERAAHL